ncbi:hypothetical protein BEWA_039160 [Theileria equi strain WA]|uniref:Uncharacterized protein n=1 Tax=Theileria equi strain WA TaxID=1537102 RepID=L1LFF3_THEEQ|nr:hypothetical protein BEWA_039160 [Theileria equi strain WA]EKX73878.1 hypothetical protein BEWA_039160 [Theileria equi strain WA]|eukprot:XP_004833330.1 hypothetical protein BEWA_039160 [Theileria equi strain WA]
MTKETGGMFEEYIGYDHISAIRDQSKFTVTSIVNGTKNIQRVGDLPLYNVEKITVYFSVCDPTTPVMIYIERDNQTTWLENQDKQGNWTDVSDKIPEIKADNGDTIKEAIEDILEGVKSDLGLCQKNPGPSGIVEHTGANASGDNDQCSYGEYGHSGENSDEEYIVMATLVVFHLHFNNLLYVCNVTIIHLV